MDYYENVKRAIQFIEDNLKEEIYVDDMERSFLFTISFYAYIYAVDRRNSRSIFEKTQTNRSSQ